MSQDQTPAKGLNNLLVVSGPSGSGKSTLIRMLLEKNQDARFCVSHTSRPKRKNEIDGKDYYFISEDKFLKMAEEGRFLEWARVYSNYYGTSWEAIRSQDPRLTVILDIDVQGARNLKKNCPLAWFVFVIPPSLPELKKRLMARRRGESRAEIMERLARAEAEMAEYALYDFIVVNDRINGASSVLDAIHTAFRHQRVKKQKQLEDILGG